MYGPRSNGNGRKSAERLADDEHAALNDRILRSLSANGQDMTARKLAGYVEAPLRQVVGRLQVLKRQGVVTFARYDSAPSAPGRWALTEKGRRTIRPDEA
jgi:predicted ArsR family transcriptional regulator